MLGFLEPLFATALRLTRNRADAEDLVQDTFVKALRFQDRFERGTNLRAWLYTILHNTWRNRRARRGPRSRGRRQRARRGAGRDGRRARPTSETPERMLLRATLDVDLQEALDELPEAFREAVWLRDVEEFSYAEIAEMLDVPIGTVMSRISRGRRLLFEKLELGRRQKVRKATKVPVSR